MASLGARKLEGIGGGFCFYQNDKPSIIFDLVIIYVLTAAGMNMNWISFVVKHCLFFSSTKHYSLPFERYQRLEYRDMGGNQGDVSTLLSCKNTPSTWGTCYLIQY
ncbi:hypothetical protein ACJX0J_031736 [Zea mays]